MNMFGVRIDQVHDFNSAVNEVKSDACLFAPVYKIVRTKDEHKSTLDSTIIEHAS